MGTIWVKEFTGGLDTRRLPETTPGGVLLAASNGHISRGGEFEKRAAFVPTVSLAAGTIGLGYTSKGLLVWGAGARPAGLDSRVQYQQLVHPVTPALRVTAINSFDLYRDNPFVSATFEDGTTYYYYNGVIVADWVFGTAQFTAKVTGGHNIVGVKAHAAFNVTGGTKTANNANRINSITVGGVAITGRAVAHTGNNNTTATAVAAEINRFVSNPNYTAVASTNKVTITASVDGVAANAKVVHVNLVGNFTVSGNDVAMAGGVAANQSTIRIAIGAFIMDAVGWKTSNEQTAKAIAAEISAFKSVRDWRGVWNGDDTFSIVAVTPGTVNNGLIVAPTYTNGFTTNIGAGHNTTAGGAAQPTNPDTNKPYLPGNFVMTVGTRMYTLSGSSMYFSMIKDPTKWGNPTVNTGAGVVDLAAYASGSEQLLSMARYQQWLAVFAMDSIQIWKPESDPANFSLIQVLHNTGTRSGHSVTQFGDSDIYYLDESGIRSLRARDSSNSASTSDVGVLVDTLVVAKLVQSDMIDRGDVFGLIEPVDGRFWLIMGSLIFVFSYFAGAKVSAWSTYDASVPTTDPDSGEEVDVPFTINEAITYRRRIYVRSGDTIYCYGGESSSGAAPFVYDRTEAVAQTPYLDGNFPAKEKDFNGIDIGCDGVWEVDALMDTAHQDAVDKVCVVEDSTFDSQRMPMTGRATHVSLRFKTRSAAKARVGAALIHYTSADGEDDGTR